MWWHQDVDVLVCWFAHVWWQGRGETKASCSSATTHLFLAVNGSVSNAEVCILCGGVAPPPPSLKQFSLHLLQHLLQLEFNGALRATRSKWQLSRDTWKGPKVFLALQISFTGRVKEGGRVLKIESFLSQKEAENEKWQNPTGNRAFMVARSVQASGCYAFAPASCWVQKTVHSLSTGCFTLFHLSFNIEINHLLIFLFSSKSPRRCPQWLVQLLEQAQLVQVWLLLLINQVLRLVNIAPDKGFPSNNVSEGASLSEVLQFQGKKKEWVTAEVLINLLNVCMMVEDHLKEEVKKQWCVICVLSNRTSLEDSLKSVTLYFQLYLNIYVYQLIHKYQILC